MSGQEKNNLIKGEIVTIRNVDGDIVTGKFYMQFWDDKGRVRTCIKLDKPVGTRSVDTGVLQPQTARHCK